MNKWFAGCGNVKLFELHKNLVGINVQLPSSFCKFNPSVVYLANLESNCIRTVCYHALLYVVLKFATYDVQLQYAML